MPPSETDGKENPQPPTGWRIIAAALAVCWIVSLIVMAIWASNPVTLNRRQIFRALDEGVIVRARVSDLETGQCEVIECWPVAEIDGTFHVTDLRQTGAKSGATYLLPLLREDGGGYAVAPGMADDEMKLIYPDTDEAIAQLEELRAE